MTEPRALSPEEEAKVRAWLAGESVRLGALFEDAAAYSDVNDALRAAFLDAARQSPDVEALVEGLRWALDCLDEVVDRVENPAYLTAYAEARAILTRLTAKDADR